MPVQRQIDRLMAQRAAEWVETLKTGGERDHEEFVKWLRQSKLHVEHYLEIVAMDYALQSLDRAQCPDLDALLARAAPNVVPIKSTAEVPVRSNRSRTRARGWQLGAALAAGVALVCVAIALQGRGFPWQTHEITTAVGEQRTLSLEDGSVVMLNTQTALRIDYSANERSITLESGEAVFRVTHDPSRPFVVHTSTAAVRALGTQFNVYQRVTGTLVSVIDGRVQVTTGPSRTGHVESVFQPPQNLGAGEEAWIQQDGGIEKRAHPDIRKTVAWRQRRLDFNETPLEDIAQEFNRYSTSTRLRLVGIAPGSRRYGGVFDADDPESLAALLERESDLKVERRNGEIVISRR